MIHSLCRYVCALLPCLLGVSLFVHSSDTRLPHACTQLMISSPVSLADEPVWIEVRGLAPFQIAEIQAETVDNKGEKWLSWALFEANEKGVISLSKAEPIAGTYIHADSMGLFWSMKPVSSPFDSFKMKGDWDVDLKVWVNGQITAQQSIKRLRKLPAVQKIEVREEGLVASLFLPPSQDPLPVIITLSGSNGGLGENRAQLLASHGFAVLALGYFGAPGLPNKLENIDLAFFEKALNWLKQRSDVQGDRVGIYGISRGAELALLLGSLFSDRIQAIVATVPSAVIFGGGLGNRPSHAWIYEGKPVGITAPIPKIELSYGQGLVPEDPIVTTPDFLKSMHDYPDAYQAAEIPVENIEAALMLISGGDDQMWPSSIFAGKVMQRLDEKGSAIERVHLSYPLAGHQISLPFLPSESVYYHPHGKLWFAMGGTPEQDDLASRDSWVKIIHFFHAHL